MCDQPTTDKPRFKKPEEVSDSEVYRALMALHMQRDTLSWSRTQVLGLIEAGVIAAAFATRGLPASVILIFGIFLLLSIWCLIERDWQCRDHYFEDALDSVHKPRNIELRPTPRIFSGKSIMRGIFISLILVNVLLAFGFTRGIGSIFQSQNPNLRSIQIQMPGQASLAYPIEPDKNVRIEFDGAKVTFSADKP